MIRSGEMLVSLTQGKAPDPLQELTDRERTILGLIGNALTQHPADTSRFASLAWLAGGLLLAG
jgi:two-component system, NarL family, nitrate/nitrite response regulator NarL